MGEDDLALLQADKDVRAVVDKTIDNLAAFSMVCQYGMSIRHVTRSLCNFMTITLYYNATFVCTIWLKLHVNRGLQRIVCQKKVTTRIL